MNAHPYKKILRPFVSAGLLLLLGGILMVCFFGCGKTAYAVDYRGQKDEYLDAQDTYKAGSKVKLTYYLVGTDTDYSFWLDGERLNAAYAEGKGFILRFTMPDHDVCLECRAVNSMVRSPIEDDENEDVMLVDFYTASVATDGGDGHLEAVLYAYTSDQAKLIVYRKDSTEDAETSTTYIVPYTAVDRCYAVIDEENMRVWNDEAPADGEEGAITVCKFRESDGSYVRVTSQAMPADGSQAFSRMRETLLSYVSDAYRQ